MSSTGIVKSYNETTGFGVITCDDGGPELLVHVSAVARAGLETLHPGQRLSFEFHIDFKRNRIFANNLRLL